MRVIFIGLMTLLVSNIVHARGSDAQVIHCKTKMGGSPERITGVHEVADLYNYWVKKSSEAKEGISTVTINAKVEFMKTWTNEKTDSAEYAWVNEVPTDKDSNTPKVLEFRFGPKNQRFTDEGTNRATESFTGVTVNDIRIMRYDSGLDSFVRTEYIIDYSHSTFENVMKFYEFLRAQALELAHKKTSSFKWTSESPLDYLTVSPPEVNRLNNEVQSILLMAESAHKVLVQRGLYLTGQDAEGVYNSFQVAAVKRQELTQSTVTALNPDPTHSTTTYGNIILSGMLTPTGVSYTVDMRNVTNPKEISDFMLLINKATSGTDLKMAQITKKVLGFGLPAVQAQTTSTLSQAFAKNTDARNQSIENMRKAVRDFRGSVRTPMMGPQVASSYLSVSEKQTIARGELRLQANAAKAKALVSPVSATQRIINKLVRDVKVAKLKEEEKERRSNGINSPDWLSRRPPPNANNTIHLGAISEDQVVENKPSSNEALTKKEFPKNNAANDTINDAAQKSKNSPRSSESQ